MATAEFRIVTNGLIWLFKCKKLPTPVLVTAHVRVEQVADKTPRRYFDIKGCSMTILN